MNDTDPITAQEWEQLTYWRRKKLYNLFVWYLTQTKIKKFIQLWTLPNFAVRQICMAQGNPITVNDEAQVNAMSEESGLCEACGKRQGETNSRYIFHSPISDPDCGDWVCLECEQEAEQDHNDEVRR